MNGDFSQSVAGDSEPDATRELDTLGSSTIYKLCEEVIALREYDKRQLRSLEQTLNKVRDELRTSFNSFAADTQRAYQQLRQETHGEKPLADYAPPAEVPDANEVRAALAVPELPPEVPAVAPLLDRVAREPIDPWAIVLP